MEAGVLLGLLRTLKAQAAESEEPDLAGVYVSSTIVGAVLFYWLRCRYPLIYGFIEIIVALVVIYITFLPPDTYMALEGSSAYGQFLRKAAGVIGGIYIFVRGMDNVSRGLPSRWRKTWNRVFPDRSTATETA